MLRQGRMAETWQEDGDRTGRLRQDRKALRQDRKALRQDRKAQTGQKGVEMRAGGLGQGRKTGTGQEG
jgi:hypothetical protein